MCVYVGASKRGLLFQISKSIVKRQIKDDLKIYSKKYNSAFLWTQASNLKAFRTLRFLTNQVLGQEAAGNACVLIAKSRREVHFVRGRRGTCKPCTHRFPPPYSILYLLITILKKNMLSSKHSSSKTEVRQDGCGWGDRERGSTYRDFLQVSILQEKHILAFISELPLGTKTKRFKSQ